jgi:uncharacterized protein (DUF3084 family)
MLQEVQRKLVKDRNQELEKRTKSMDARDKALDARENIIIQRCIELQATEREIEEKSSMTEYKLEQISNLHKMISAALKLYEKNRRNGVAIQSGLETLDWNVRDEAESWQINLGLHIIINTNDFN